MTPHAVSYITRIIKRDGSVKPFDPSKIESALLRAGQASGEFDAQEASRMTAMVALQRIMLNDNVAPNVEQIQDLVESVLYDAGYRQTLRAYIVYREQHQKLRRDRKTLVDVESSMNEYLHESNSKLLVVQPLKDDREGKDSKKPARAAVVMECFERDRCLVSEDDILDGLAAELGASGRALD